MTGEFRVCPTCSSAYDLGLVEDRLKDIKPVKVAQYKGHIP